MATVIPVGYTKVIVSMTGPIPGKTMSFSFGVDVAPSSTLDTALTNWWGSGAAGSLKHAIYSQYTVVGFDCIGNSTVRFVTINAAGSGSAAGLMPPGVCAIVAKNIGTVGRANRGRVYVPGVLAEADVDNLGAVLTATRTNVGIDFANLTTRLTAISAHQVILHDTAGPTPVLVTAMQVQSVVGQQRRRQR